MEKARRLTIPSSTHAPALRPGEMKYSRAPGMMDACAVP
jgi:hypothetical protein